MTAAMTGETVKGAGSFSIACSTAVRLLSAICWPTLSASLSLSPMHGYGGASTRPVSIVSRGKADLSHASTVSNKASAWMRFPQPRRCHIVVHLTMTVSHRRGYGGLLGGAGVTEVTHQK